MRPVLPLSILSLLAIVLAAAGPAAATHTSCNPPNTLAENETTVLNGAIVVTAGVRTHGNCVSADYAIGGTAIACPFSPLHVVVQPVVLVQQAIVCDKAVYVHT